MDISSVVGPILVGACLGSCACGIVLALAARYAARFSEDRLWIRFAVVTAVLFALLDAAVTCSWAYQWSVRLYGQPFGLLIRPWQLPSAIYFGAFTILACQHFFIYRLFAVSEQYRWWLAVPSSTCSIAGAAVAFYMASYVAQRPSMISLPSIGNVPWGWFGPTLTADLLITTSLLWFLNWGPRARLGVTPNASIRRIASSAARTNFLSFVLQLATCILYSRYNVTLNWFYLSPILNKIHIASFIATLNARQGNGPDSFDDYEHSSGGRGGPRSSRRSIGQLRSGISVHQDVTVATDAPDYAAATDSTSRFSDGIPLGAYKVHFDGEAGPEKGVAQVLTRVCGLERI
ncbi:hypothetical protein BMF94_1960 [Rhodotorula taiwanensis]|uniref:DUF6534 domain-containing protein n=1 Tax=Rhodotorula taiwanensis TaxID=741276 RepID=A0A2S5BDY3_9BASI|nr:hypothetical protein BMF94_1960 [Rhodotorula taiwanensis]